MIARHRSNYRPWWPHGKIVRTRGEINSTNLVIFWLWWVVDVDVSRTRKARLKAIWKREIEAARRAGIESQTSVNAGGFRFIESQTTTPPIWARGDSIPPLKSALVSPVKGF